MTGATWSEHLKNLELVLERLRAHGIRVKCEKCRFMQESVEYLGFRIDSKGLHATTDKLKAISEAPQPTNIQELRAFLGLLNYYGRFVPNLSSLIHPLNRLLCKDAHWKWTESCAHERNYSQVEKEGLSLIFGVKKFHTYLYGRKFSLVTDHKPLTTIFGPKHGIPSLATARLQRWALILAAYNYDIKFRPTGAHVNADSLS